VTRLGLQRWADAPTISRAAFLPALVGAAEAARRALEAGRSPDQARALVLAVLLAIGASDMLDGWLARRSGAPPTRRGAILDAAADRLVQWTGVWYFAVRGAPAFPPLPLWLAGTLVLRDGLLLAIWLRQRRAKAASFEHELHGKAATVTIFCALVASAWSAPSVVVMAAALASACAIAYSTVRYAVRLAGE
jgi:phosphatidylglycerophosphate synthase